MVNFTDDEELSNISVIQSAEADNNHYNITAAFYLPDVLNEE